MGDMRGREKPWYDVDDAHDADDDGRQWYDVPNSGSVSPTPLREVFVERRAPRGFFRRLRRKLASKKGVRDPAALAAWIKRHLNGDR